MAVKQGIQTMLLGKTVIYWTDDRTDTSGRFDPSRPCPEGRKEVHGANVVEHKATVLNVYLDAENEVKYTVADMATDEVKETAWIKMPERIELVYRPVAGAYRTRGHVWVARFLTAGLRAVQFHLLSVRRGEQRTSVRRGSRRRSSRRSTTEEQNRANSNARTRKRHGTAAGDDHRKGEAPAETVAVLGLARFFGRWRNPARIPL